MARRFHRQESPRVTVSFPFFRKPVCGKCCRYSLLCTRMPSTGVLWWLMLCGRRGQTWTDCEVTQRLGDWQRQRDQCTLPPIHIRVAGPSHGMPANPHSWHGRLLEDARTDSAAEASRALGSFSPSASPNRPLHYLHVCEAALQWPLPWPLSYRWPRRPTTRDQPPRCCCSSKAACTRHPRALMREVCSSWA